MAIDLCQYEMKAKNCPQALLADVFLSLLRVVKEYVVANTIPTAQVESILDKFNAPIEIKATVKRKAPAKKKAPGPKIGGVNAQLIYCPFFWVPTQGNPSTTNDLREELLPLDCREAAQYLEVEPLPLVSYCDVPGSSVYTMALSTADQDQIFQATSVFLKKWFLKTSRDRSGVAEGIDGDKPAKAVVPTQRPTMLSASYAQRYGILIFTLKKACGGNASIAVIENMILSCTIGPNEVGLLSESLQNPHETDELRASVASIETFVNERRYEDLYDDEKFLYFISRIPNVKERMCCLYVASTFRSVAEQLISRMAQIRSALNLLVLNVQLHKIHQLILSVCNELNHGHAVRSGLKYFRLSTFDKLIDLKGTEGMTLAAYLSHFMGRICEDEDEQKFLSKASQFGVVNTYNATKDLINTYMCLAGVHKNSKLVPTNSPHYPEDCYQEFTQKAAKDLFPDVQNLVQEFYAFVACYTTATYFFGDPNTLLPLDQASGRAIDDEGGATRDLLQRYMAVMQLIKPPRKRKIELSSEARELSKPVAPIEATTVSRRRSTERMPMTNTTPAPEAPQPRSENLQPSQKRVKISSETPFAPAVICPSGPSSRRLMTLRGRMGNRSAMQQPNIPLPRADAGRARTSISNAFSLARDLNHLAAAD